MSTRRLQAMRREVHTRELQLMDAVRRKYMENQSKVKEVELKRMDDEIQRKVSVLCRLEFFFCAGFTWLKINVKLKNNPSENIHTILRPVSTQEKKSIESDRAFFYLVSSTPPDQTKLEILQLFIIRVADHRFKLEQKIGIESPRAGSILFRSGPIPCLFS